MTQLRDRLAAPSRLVLVLTTLALVVLVLVQAALAGAHLDGDPDALDTHRRLAETIGFTTLAQLAAATLWAVTGGARWPVAVTAALFVLTGNQIGWGTDRALDAHVPVGVGLLGAHTALAVVLLRTRHGATAAAPSGGWPRSVTGRGS